MFSKYFYLGLPISCGPPLERDRLGELGSGEVRMEGRRVYMGREGESIRGVQVMTLVYLTFPHLVVPHSF